MNNELQRKYKHGAIDNKNVGEKNDNHVKTESFAFHVFHA